MKNQPACTGTHLDMFFPTAGMSIEPALKLCQTCPAKEECRELGQGAPGIWGGEYHGKPAKCQQCGTMMVAAVGRRSVCVECHGGPIEDPDEPYRPVIPGECYRCGQSFEQKPGKVFCSRTCQRRHNESPPAPWRGVVKPCPNCGTEFEMVRSTQVACSKPCNRKMRTDRAAQARRAAQDKMTIR